MTDWRELTIEDRELVSGQFTNIDPKSYMYCFGTLFMWRDLYGVKVCEQGDSLLVSLNGGYLLPQGKGSERAIEALIANAKQNTRKLQFTALNDKLRAYLAENYKGVFSFKENRDNSSYIYLLSNLAELPGSKYQEERRKIHRFERENQNITCEPIGKENINECILLYDDWIKGKADTDNQNNKSLGKEDGSLILAEEKAIRTAFEYFSELGLIGIILRIGGKAVAFDIAEIMPGASDKGITVDLHFEKGSYEIRDVYQKLRLEFAKYIRTEYPGVEFVNFEDDLGLPGLRNWKMQYNPYMLLTSYTAELIL